MSIENEREKKENRRRDQTSLPPPRGPMKVALALIWLFSSFAANSLSLVVTHERLPEVAPLPDVLHQTLPQHRWGTTLSDIAVVFGILIALIVVLLHQHRLVILCRVWVILGILYFYRAVAMLVTTFPHPDPGFTCAPKLNDTHNFAALVSRAAIALSTGGLTFSQNSIFCGDFMFSGHTMTLVMAHLTVDQYAKNHLNLRLCGRLLAIIGICSMLVGRGHYSIDVFIAYLLTVHVWWIYHALAYNHKSPQHTPWWFALFVFFESNAPFDLPPLPSDASSSDLEPAFDDKVIVIPKITKKEDIAIPKITKKDDKGLF